MNVIMEIRNERQLLEIMSQLAENVPSMRISKREADEYRSDMQKSLRVNREASDVEEEVLRASKVAMGTFKKHILAVGKRLPKGAVMISTPYPSVLIVTDEEGHMGDGEIIAKGEQLLAAK